MTLTEIINLFPPITLEEMSGIRLMNRIDTKFVTTIGGLKQFLMLAREDYYVQDWHGLRLMPYHTIYLDTPRLTMYYDHHNGHKHRYKVRMRMYENDGATFLEVKDKNNHGRTKKKRILIDELEYAGDEMKEFVEDKTPYDATTLIPTIENRFRRITLVNKARTERLTIDVDLQFHNIRCDGDCTLGHHVIIELKRDGLIPSPATALLRRVRIKRSGFSKMAMGMALTDPHLKQNRFKQRRMTLKRLLREELTMADDDNKIE